MLTQQSHYDLLKKHSPYPDKRVIPTGISESSLYRGGTVFDDYTVRLNVKGRPKVLTNEGGAIIVAEIDRVIDALTKLKAEVVDAVKYEELKQVIDAVRDKM